MPPEANKLWIAEHSDKAVPVTKDGKSDMRRVKPAAKRMMK